MDKMEKQAAAKIENWLKQIEEGEMTIAMLQESISADETDLLELVFVAQKLRQTSHPELSNEWKLNTRHRILNRIAVKSPIAQRVYDQPNLRRIWTMRLSKLLSTMALIFAFLLVAGSVSLITQNALPGDLLYPAKIAIEDMQLVTAVDAEDAILIAQFAGNRLTEIQLLIAKDRFEDVDIAVAAFENEINQAVLALAQLALSDSQQTYPVLLQVEKVMRGYTTNLTELLTLVPTETKHALEYAITASQSLTLVTD